LFDLSLFAVQRLADGRWLMRALMGDPVLPAVDVVGVLGEQAPTQVVVLPPAMPSECFARFCIQRSE
jgi:hypothetical protein